MYGTMKLKSSFFAFFLIISNVILGQNYFNSIIPDTLDFNLNPGNIEVLDENYFISALRVDNASSIIVVDSKDLDIIKYITIDSFRVAIKAFLNNEGELFVAGKNTPSAGGELEIKAIDEMSELYSTFGNYSTDSNSSVPGPSIKIDGNFYSANMTDFIGSDHREIMLKKIGLDGIEEWSTSFGEGDIQTYCWDIEESLDTNVLLSTGVNRQGVKSQLIKLDKNGNEIWTFTSEESADSGAVGHYIAQLSNENIILTTILDRHSDVDFIVNDWYPFPPKFTWIDNEGQEISSMIMTSAYHNVLKIVDLEPGLGEYFFGYGRWTDPISDIAYGWIFKMDNNGLVIWDKKFRHPDHLEAIHRIADLVELDSGDLLMLGSFIEPGMKLNIWLLKINENGCFGGDSCEDFLSADKNLLEIDKENLFKIYPNPAFDGIEILSSPDFKYDRIEIFNEFGQRVKMINQDWRKIDITDLINGIYFFKVYSKNASWTERFIVQKN